MANQAEPMGFPDHGRCIHERQQPCRIAIHFRTICTRSKHHPARQRPSHSEVSAFALTAVRPDGAPAPHTESPFLANLSIEPVARTLGDAVEKTGGMPVIFSMT